MTVLSTYIEQRLLEIDGKKLRKISKNVIFRKDIFEGLYIEIIIYNLKKETHDQSDIFLN